MTPRQYVGLRISNDAEAVPTLSDIDEGDLAINLASERIYMRFGEQIRDITDRYTRAEMDQLLEGKADATHGHTWTEISGKPATATRWPAFSEVTDKPASYPPTAHGHGWNEIDSKPSTATRWPAFSEVTDKPASYPPTAHGHGWNEIDSKPSTATRWPAFSEVTDKPATYPPDSHAHTLSQITDAGTAAGADVADFDPAGTAASEAYAVRRYVDSRPDPLLMHFL
ncbi:hypothetical protein K1Y77_17245 (plasmid) [Halomonas qaidamensis]|uniref:Uncharacterized protein n=1 Tax=Halomonas qaidamensis TaxID=2866211 RepID=A0ABY6JVA8_9GAMM|nr:hypothetical protein [Halomonas qaidamensis]UYV20907.1 hypothetical protein K1Y77_17245 [Halomonas qaidamensis]